MQHTIAVFLRHRGAILLVRDHDGDIATRWSVPTSTSETEPTDARADAVRLARDATGRDAPAINRSGRPFELADAERTVYPFLVDVPNRRLAGAFDGHAWVQPTAILERYTSPGLWKAYLRVAPSASSIAADTTHGASALSVRALEHLRDRAAVADDWDELAVVARALRETHPSMAVIANRINRVMEEAEDAPGAVHAGAIRALENALTADASAAERTVKRLRGPVATISRSGTVERALRTAGRPVTVSVSQPGAEGVALAESLADDDVPVTITTDAALPQLLADRDFGAVVVGADTVLPSGDIVNKVGTRAVALAADWADVPVYVVAARDKIAPTETVSTEIGPPEDVYDGPADLDVANPIFDRTPATLVTGVITERGLLDRRGIRATAARHRAQARWDEEA
ncbi:translation initiation factor 2 [Haloferacaceae archaeon DSL9]